LPVQDSDVVAQGIQDLAIEFLALLESRNSKCFRARLLAMISAIIE
jgi:hypothetical protein